MATGAETRGNLQVRSVIHLPNDDFSGRGLLLRVAFEAQIRISFHQQFRVD
jgi:hypothetical protein